MTEVFLCAHRRTPIGRYGGALATRNGAADVVTAGGVNSTSRAPDVMPMAETGVARGPDIFDSTISWRFVHALRSQSRHAASWHAADFLPVTIPGRKGKTVVCTNEHPRSTSPERLAALPATLRPPVTAGNASVLNDGAAGVILVSETAILRHGLPPPAVWPKVRAGLPLSPCVSASARASR